MDATFVTSGSTPKHPFHLKMRPSRQFLAKKKLKFLNGTEPQSRSSSNLLTGVLEQTKLQQDFQSERIAHQATREALEREIGQRTNTDIYIEHLNDDLHGYIQAYNDCKALLDKTKYDYKCVASENCLLSREVKRLRDQVNILDH